MSRPLSIFENFTFLILRLEFFDTAFKVANSHAAKDPIRVSSGLSTWKLWDEVPDVKSTPLPYAFP
jgi:hypothetical protein